ncbi:MAG TPA: hypothetical protein DD416_14230 [Rhodobacteraceae bacterium]|nr:hypothetical protein [Paracoccaceae bacterium]
MSDSKAARARPIIVFDFDGVIADSHDVCAAACRWAAAELGHSDMPEKPFAELEAVTYEALAATISVDPERFAGLVCGALEARTTCAPIFFGVADIMMELSRDFDIAILSASDSDLINDFLITHGIWHLVKCVMGRDVPGSKTEKLLALKSAHDGKFVAMIGDGVSDVAAALHADVRAVGVAWGWQSARRLRASGADAIAMVPADLLDLIVVQELTEAPTR